MKLSMQGERVLRALGDGRVFRMGTDGWTAGAIRAPASLVEELGRADFVRRGEAGLVLTDAGRARITKTRPQRLLEERAVPDPASPRAARRTVTVNLLESPLGWLFARGHLDRRQFDAGERLRGDWTTAGLSPRVTMRWDSSPRAAARTDPGAPLDPTLAGIAAKRRFEEAVEAAGKGLSDILWRVVCQGEGLEAAETALG